MGAVSADQFLRGLAQGAPRDPQRIRPEVSESQSSLHGTRASTEVPCANAPEHTPGESAAVLRSPPLRGTRTGQMPLCLTKELHRATQLTPVLTVPISTETVGVTAVPGGAHQSSSQLA